MSKAGHPARASLVVADPELRGRYRERYTNEPDAAARTARFTSEASAAASSLGPDFSVRADRVLPGLPKPVEVLRTKLVDARGLDGALWFAEALGVVALPGATAPSVQPEMMTVSGLRRKLSTLRLALSV